MLTSALPPLTDPTKGSPHESWITHIEKVAFEATFIFFVSAKY